MKKTKAVVAWNAGELAKALGLTPADGAKIEPQSDLNTKIAEGGRRRDSHFESQYEGHFDGSQVASVVRVGVYGKGTV